MSKALQTPETILYAERDYQRYLRSIAEVFETSGGGGFGWGGGMCHGGAALVVSPWSGLALASQFTERLCVTLGTPPLE